MDEGLAWAIFGSNDIVGMRVWLGENVYVVAGVVGAEKGNLNETAYGNGNRMYMCYDELKKREESLKVTCYEATVPNPISNYAYYALRNACGLPEEAAALSDEKVNPLNFEDIEVIENSNRYEFMPLYKKIKILEFQSMRTNSIVYPYWENVARAVETEQIYYLIARIFVLIFPVFSLIWWIHHLWKQRKWRMKDIVRHIFEKLQNKVEERRERKAEAKAVIGESSEPKVENEVQEDESEEGETEKENTEEFEIEEFE